MANFDRQLAAYVAEQLRAADLDLRPKIERRWIPVFEVDDLTTPRICVAPRTQERTVSSRTSWKRTHIVQAGIFAATKSLPSGQVDDVRADRLSDLVESVLDAVCGFDAFEGASLVSAETELLYDPDDLKKSGLFRSVLTFTYTRIKR